MCGSLLDEWLDEPSRRVVVDDGRGDRVVGDVDRLVVHRGDRVDWTVGISYGDDVDAARQAILATITPRVDCATYL